MCLKVHEGGSEENFSLQTSHELAETFRKVPAVLLAGIGSNLSPQLFCSIKMNDSANKKRTGSKFMLILKSSCHLSILIDILASSEENSFKQPFQLVTTLH